MGTFFFWVLMLAIGVLASYASVPALLQGLQNQAPFEYNDLGCPDEADVFARWPNRLQTRFMWFVLSGQAYAVTNGSARTSAVFAWLGYVLTAIALLGMLVVNQMHG